jgi:hypothetical protein
MRASPQQQRLGPLPSSSPFPPNCNPQRCDICPGTTSEGDFHGWSKDQAHNARTTHGALRYKLGTRVLVFFLVAIPLTRFPFHMITYSSPWHTST